MGRIAYQVVRVVDVAVQNLLRDPHGTSGLRAPPRGLQIAVQLGRTRSSTDYLLRPSRLRATSRQVAAVAAANSSAQGAVCKGRVTAPSGCP